VKPRLYHYTAEPWWILIAQMGEILSYAEKVRRGMSEPGAVSILGGKFVQNSAPVNNEWDQAVDELVWLTPVRHPAQQWQQPIMGTAPEQKGAIRIEVEAPNAVRWQTHARHIGFPRSYYDALDATGDSQSVLWWVSKVPIPQERWVRVERTSDGLVLYDRELAGRT
jgi:hypothetical protein